MADDSEQISQDEIEKLLSGAKTPGTPLPGEKAEAPSPAAGQKPAAAPAPSAEPCVPPVPPETLTLAQNEIEALLKENARSAPAATKPPATDHGKVGSAAGSPLRGAAASGLPATDIEFLFQQAEQALASVQGPQPAPPGVATFKLLDFGGAPASTENATLDLLRDVELDLKIELGRTHMYLEDVLRLSKGAVVPLDRLAGDPVDIFVNGRLIARGEVLILNDNFCVRVAELMAGEAAVAASA
jgi:flagellar motor switch protein FliN/FliY